MKHFFTTRRLVVAAVALFYVLNAAGAAFALSQQEEIELGSKLNKEILKEYPLSKDEAAQKEVNEIGQRLAKGVKRTGIPYNFAVIDAGSDFNAFALPGGYIYFTKRLWDILRPEERIGVLGHEIVHVDNRHGIDAISKARKRAIWTALLLTLLKANDTWADLADLANSMYTLKYSRGDERQADEQGIEIIRKAQMNPVGLLLAMRKIGRLQQEAGGEPPKIFSSHPPTKERLAYIHEILARNGIPVPPEDIVQKPATGIIGKVTHIGGGKVTFVSSRPLQPGDVVWLMGIGWDYYYEARTEQPMARAFVIAADNFYTAEYVPLDEVKEEKLTKGMSVCYSEHVTPPESQGLIQPSASGTARLELRTNPAKYDRYLCYQTVWDAKNSKFTSDVVGALVVGVPNAGKSYLAVQRPGFAYAPITKGCDLVKLIDKDVYRWVGPVISIGRGGQTVEIITERALSPDKTYEIAYPAWDSHDDFKDRVVAHARLIATDKKIVMKITGYTPGWTIARIANGFDVYEQAEESKSEPQKK